MNNGVGGTVVYSAWLRRYMPGDFKNRTSVINRYGEEALPKGSAIADWPIATTILSHTIPRSRR